MRWLRRRGGERRRESARSIAGWGKCGTSHEQWRRGRAEKNARPWLWRIGYAGLGGSSSLWKPKRSKADGVRSTRWRARSAAVRGARAGPTNAITSVMGTHVASVGQESPSRLSGLLTEWAYFLYSTGLFGTSARSVARVPMAWVRSVLFYASRAHFAAAAAVSGSGGYSPARSTQSRRSSGMVTWSSSYFQVRRPVQSIAVGSSAKPMVWPR